MFMIEKENRARLTFAEPYMAASLVPMEGGLPPYVLDKPIILIGRNQDCDISLQASSKISRRHCCIVQCGDRYLLRDLGSMNGVRVNSSRVIESELKPGDEVSVADLEFTFRVEDGKARQVPRLGQQTSLPASQPPDSALPARNLGDPGYPIADAIDADRSLPSQSFRDDQIPNDEIGLKDDSESEAGFVRV